MKRVVLIVAMVLLPVSASAYEQGDFSVSGGGSLRFDPDGSIFVLSLGVGYFVVDGLELGLSTSAFFGADPFVTQVTVGPRYIFYKVPVIKPYVGAFYRHWFVADNFPDVDTVGGRAGVVFQPDGSRIAISGGLVYERVISSCSEECNLVYPELSFSLHF